MTGQVTDFNRIAEAVVEKAAELLCAQVVVVNERGEKVAVAQPPQAEFPADADRGESGQYLRIPLKLKAAQGEVLVGEALTGEAISPRLAEALVELIISQTIMIDRLPNLPELKNSFIHDLLHGVTRDEPTVMRQAKLLGMDFTPPRAVILIDAASYILGATPNPHDTRYEATVRRRAQLVIGSVVSFFHLPSDTICAYIGDGEVAVLKASNTENLVSWVEGAEGHDQPGPSWSNIAALHRAAKAMLMGLRNDTGAPITIGIGRYHPGLAGIAASYADARAALSLGKRFHGPNRVHYLGDLGIAAFVGVADERTKIDLATYMLSPLDHEPELLDTLKMFFDHDCCPSTTASALAIHRNTLSYRLDKIASLTGLNPRHFDAAVQMRLALVLRSLQNSAS